MKADPILVTSTDVVATYAGCNPADLVWSNEELREAQLADTDIGVIMTWMSVGAEKPPWERVAPYSSTTKTLWHQWCRLSLCDGILYRAFYSPDGLSVSQQLVVPFRYRVEIHSISSREYDWWTSWS